MARYPKGEKNPTETLPHSDLPHLTPNEYDFVNLYLSDPKIAGNATACFRKAFPDSKAQGHSVTVMACELVKAVEPWLNMLTQMKGEQARRTKEYRISEMEAFAQRCEAAGQYGAAFQARQAAGKLEGQYVELSEDVNRTRDQLASLKDIAQTMGEDKALEFATMAGMQDEWIRERAKLN